MGRRLLLWGALGPGGSDGDSDVGGFEAELAESEERLELHGAVLVLEFGVPFEVERVDGRKEEPIEAEAHLAGLV